MNKKGKQIIIKHVSTDTCKYYRKEGGETFDLNHLGPPGICLDLYSAAYPYCLGLLYGAQFSWEQDKNAVNAQCPVPEGNVHFEVRRIPLEKMVIREGIKKNYDILIKIIDIEKSSRKYQDCSSCPHKPGQEFEFNQGDHLDQMCPAAFYSIYPTLKTIINGGKSSWTKNDKFYMRCPDNKPNITFEIQKKKGKN